MNDFSPENVEKRFDRQTSKCALCGKLLVYENSKRNERGAWAAHHIDGIRRHNNITNCACVCINRPNCHLHVAHGGDYKRGRLAPRSWFRLTGWKNSELHRINRGHYYEVLKFHCKDDRDFLECLLDEIRDFLGI